MKNSEGRKREHKRKFPPEDQKSKKSHQQKGQNVPPKRGDAQKEKVPRGALSP